MRSNGRLGKAFVVLGLGVLAGSFLAPDARGARSDKVVKVSARADKPDADGNQVVTVTLNIEKGWHAYANPVGQKDFPGIETAVTITGKPKPQKVKVEYPRGKPFNDPSGGGSYFVYEDRAVIKAHVQRAKGDTGPLVVTVKVQACTNKVCLQPATVKLTVK